MRKRQTRAERPEATVAASARERAGQVRALLHELHVHSEELAAQNEQLVRTQAELEHARDRLATLYDFAPIGYLTLNEQGVITEANLTAAELCEHRREFLVGLPVFNLLATGDRDRMRQFLQRARAEHTPPGMIELTLSTKSRRRVRFVTRVAAVPADSVKLLTAMLDVSAEQRLEADNAAAYQAEQRKSELLEREVEVRISTEERVKALLERLVNVQEQERRRLALNLHDQLGQQLTALRLALATLRDAGDDNERSGRFERVEEIVAQLDRDVDFLAWELRPPALDDVGLEAALAEFVRQWSSTNGVAARLHHTPRDSARLPTEIESNLYRIVQEALNNVAKHARAQHVSVIFERRAGELTLIIEDDGGGFDPEDQEVRRRGMGLAGIDERTAAIGGALEVESSTGRGTTLFIRIPLNVAPHRAKLSRKV